MEKTYLLLERLNIENWVLIIEYYFIPPQNKN